MEQAKKAVNSGYENFITNAFDIFSKALGSVTTPSEREELENRFKRAVEHANSAKEKALAIIDDI